MLYECSKCYKKFNQKSHYEYHINRKYPCTPLSLPTKNPPNPAKSPPKAYQTPTKIPPNPAKIPPNLTNFQLNLSEDINNKIILLEPSNIVSPLQCKYCYKTFSRTDTLKKHIANNCKIKKNNNVTKETIDIDPMKETNDIIIKKLLEEMQTQMATICQNYTKLEEENMELKQELSKKAPEKVITNNTTINDSPIAVNSTVNSNNTVVINNTNIIVPFGKENLNELVSDAACTYILSRGLSAITELIKYVHFNNKHPKYHNCYISNARDNHAIIYNGSNWSLVDAIDVIKVLVENKGEFLENKYEELAPILSETTSTQFKRYLQKKNTEDLAKRYKKDIKLILYNGRDIVAMTRKTKALKDK